MPLIHQAPAHIIIFIEQEDGFIKAAISRKSARLMRKHALIKKERSNHPQAYRQGLRVGKNLREIGNAPERTAAHQLDQARRIKACFRIKRGPLQKRLQTAILKDAIRVADQQIFGAGGFCAKIIGAPIAKIDSAADERGTKLFGFSALPSCEGIVNDDGARTLNLQGLQDMAPAHGHC